MQGHVDKDAPMRTVGKGSAVGGTLQIAEVQIKMLVYGIRHTRTRMHAHARARVHKQVGRTSASTRSSAHEHSCTQTRFNLSFCIFYLLGAGLGDENRADEMAEEHPLIHVDLIVIVD